MAVTEEVLDPPWPPPTESVTPRLRSNAAAFLAQNRAADASARSGAMWEFDVTLIDLQEADARRWGAFLMRAQEENRVFYWNHYPLNRLINFPAGEDEDSITFDSTVITMDSTAVTMDNGYSFGSPYVASGVEGAGEIGISGLAPGAVWKAGDLIAWFNGVYREMHYVAEDVTADGAGDASVSVVTKIARTPALGTPIFTDGHTANVERRCACEVKVKTYDSAGYAQSGYQGAVKFTLEEVPR